MAKTHKTIFGTTEKSNFILNMTNDQFSKTASVMFSVGFILIFIASAVAELMANAPVTESNYDWKIIPSVGLGIAGILAVSIFIIALIKQTLGKKQIVASVIALVLTVCMYISYINAVTTVPDYNAFLGFRYGRYEGLMVVLSYVFIFAGAFTINRQKTVNSIFRIFSLVTLLECIWAALQFIPSFPSFYFKIPYLMVNPMLPSGTAGSPVFLATLLTAGLAVSAFGTMHDKSGGFSAIYKITVLPAAFFLVKTQCLIGFISAAVLLFAVLADFLKSKKSGSVSSASVTLMITGYAAAVVFILIKGFRIYDGAEIWQDGCRRLSAFGQYSASVEGAFDLHDVTQLYPYLWGKAVEIIRQFPVTGIGPDAFVFTDRTTSVNDVPLSADRAYNELLFYAATLGIPSAVSLAALFFCSAANGVKSAVKDGNWVFRASVTVTLLYIVTSVITNSTSTVTPFIWFLFGICCCTLGEDNENTAKAKTKSKSK